MIQKFLPNAPAENDLAVQIASRGVSLLEPTEIASTIVWLLSEESGKITGANVPVGIGIP